MPAGDGLDQDEIARPKVFDTRGVERDHVRGLFYSDSMRRNHRAVNQLPNGLSCVGTSFGTGVLFHELDPLAHPCGGGPFFVRGFPWLYGAYLSLEAVDSNHVERHGMTAHWGCFLCGLAAPNEMPGGVAFSIPVLACRNRKD